MTGGKNLLLKTPNVDYEIYLRNKFTILLGDSATGKTALRDFLLEATNVNTFEEGIYNLESDFSEINVIYNEASLITAIKFSDSLCIVDEGLIPFVRRHLEDIRNSDSFFLFITREVDIYLGYGILDVLKLNTIKLGNGRFKTYSDSYISFEESLVSPELCITEDSGGGFNFYKNTLNVECVTAKTKTKVPKVALKYCKKYNKLLLIVDEVGFGYEFYVIYRREKDLLSEDISLWCPYSFEYMLLNSGMFDSSIEEDILKNPYRCCDFSKYSTVEKYIESCVVKLFRRMGYEYTKGFNVLDMQELNVLEVYKRNLDNYENLLK